MSSIGRPLVRLALVAGAALAIGATASAGRPMGAIPPGCALGIAGPALGPATSLREARDAAFAALAAERLPVRLASQVSWRGARVREVAHEQVHGRLRGIRIAALRGDAGGRMDALACGPEADPGALGPDWDRGWPSKLPRRMGCTLGMAGVDINPGTRARTARADAVEMLARMREVEVHHVLRVQGGRRVDRSHVVRATEAAYAETRALEDDLTEQRWLDREGRGPLGLPGILYLQICLPDT